MHGSSDRPRLWIRVFAAPIVLAVVTITGLLAALLWGEFGQYVAWVTVGAPVFIVIWILLRRGLNRVSFSSSGRRGQARVD